MSPPPPPPPHINNDRSLGQRNIDITQQLLQYSCYTLQKIDQDRQINQPIVWKTILLTLESQLNYVQLIIFSLGGTQSIHVGEVFKRVPYCTIKKLHQPETVESWHKNILPKEIQDLNASILIHSIKQNVLVQDFASIG